MRILIFDSGSGGLGTAAALRPLLPHAALIYLADNAGFPYGEKPDAALTADILRLMHTAIDAIRPDLVVIACNTASTIALGALRDRFAVPFIGCVPPIKWAADISRTRIIGLLATPATIRRPYLQDLTARHAADCTVIAHGAPYLARLAEARFRGDPIDPARVAADLQGLLNHPQSGLIDVMALGCTHYARLLPELRAAFAPHVTWLDPAPSVARQTARMAAGLATPNRTHQDAPAPFTPAPFTGVLFTGVLFTGALPAGAEAASWAASGFPDQRPL
jgi:glutamate racemase